MKRPVVFLSALVFLAACGAPSVPQAAAPLPDDGDTAEMANGNSFSAYTGALYVDPSTVTAERAAFKQQLLKSGHQTAGKRELYSQTIDVIGANGILDGIQETWPGCHNEAHALGYVIYDKTKDIGTGLQVCADGCYSGCMHGVLMEAFSGLADPDDSEGHVDLASLKERMNDVCYKNGIMQGSYSPGDCAHGVGHAVMYLADYDVPKAIGYCKEFKDTVMQYYCATGAYMEYVTERDKQDAISKPVLYPCTDNLFPAACTRYKMVHVIARHYTAGGDLMGLLQLCSKQEGADQIACFHGLGNAHMSLVFDGRVQLADLCRNGTEDDQVACVEGAMERMAKYHESRAVEVCGTVDGLLQRICQRSVANKMYSMTKDMSLYLRED